MVFLLNHKPTMSSIDKVVRLIFSQVLIFYLNLNKLNKFSSYCLLNVDLNLRMKLLANLIADSSIFPFES